MSHNIDKLKFTLPEGDLEVLKFNLCHNGTTKRIKNEAYWAYYETYMYFSKHGTPLMAYYSKHKTIPTQICISINPSGLGMDLYDSISWVKSAADPSIAKIGRLDHKVDRQDDIALLRKSIIIPGKGEGYFRTPYFRIGSAESSYAIYDKYMVDPTITKSDMELASAVPPSLVRIERRDTSRMVRFETFGDLLDLKFYSPFTNLILANLKSNSRLRFNNDYINRLSMHDYYVSYGSGKNRKRDFGKHFNFYPIGEELNDIYQEEVKSFVGDPNKILKLLGIGTTTLSTPNLNNTINSTLLLS